MVAELPYMIFACKENQAKKVFYRTTISASGHNACSGWLAFCPWTSFPIFYNLILFVSLQQLPSSKVMYCRIGKLGVKITIFLLKDSRSFTEPQLFLGLA